MNVMAVSTDGADAVGLATAQRSTAQGSTILGSTTLGSTTLGSTTLGSTTLGSTTLGSSGHRITNPAPNGFGVADLSARRAARG
jgi:hypothetical protein